MPTRKHVVITGTGRNGTTLLVELLTHLGLDTGFRVEDLEANKSEVGRAGLEHDIRREDSPYIVKSPGFCYYAEEVICRDEIIIEHVFVPVRDLSAAAESRRFVNKSNVEKMSWIMRLKHRIKPQNFLGGLWHTSSSKPGKQEEMLLMQLYKLLLAISDTALPVTFMRYPRIINDCAYLYAKLGPILGSMTYEAFNAGFSRAVRPELVHSFNKEDR